MRSAAAVVMLMISAGAQAHPGHGVTELWHLLTEPDHLALLLLPLGIAGALLLARYRARKAKKPFRG